MTRLGAESAGVRVEGKEGEPSKPVHRLLIGQQPCSLAPALAAPPSGKPPEPDLLRRLLRCRFSAPCADAVSDPPHLILRSRTAPRVILRHDCRVPTCEGVRVLWLDALQGCDCRCASVPRKGAQPRRPRASWGGEEEEGAPSRMHRQNLYDICAYEVRMYVYTLLVLRTAQPSPWPRAQNGATDPPPSRSTG